MELQVSHRHIYVSVSGCLLACAVSVTEWSLTENCRAHYDARASLHVSSVRLRHVKARAAHGLAAPHEPATWHAKARVERKVQ